MGCFYRAFFIMIAVCAFHMPVLGEEECPYMASKIARYHGGGVEKFLRYKCISNDGNWETKGTPLQWAIGGGGICPGNFLAVRDMLAVNPNLAKSKGYGEFDTMLAYSISNCCDTDHTKDCGKNRQYEIAQLLIENGADVNATTIRKRVGLQSLEIPTERTMLDFVREHMRYNDGCKNNKAGLAICKNIETLLIANYAKTYAELHPEQAKKTANISKNERNLESTPKDKEPAKTESVPVIQESTNVAAVAPAKSENTDTAQKSNSTEQPKSEDKPVESTQPKESTETPAESTNVATVAPTESESADTAQKSKQNEQLKSGDEAVKSTQPKESESVKPAKSTNVVTVAPAKSESADTAQNSKQTKQSKSDDNKVESTQPKESTGVKPADPRKLVARGASNARTGTGTIRVSGVVLDATTGKPLPFVNLSLVNNKGTTTDMDGKFSSVFQGVPLNSKLTVSYTGYEKQTVDPGVDMTIMLKPGLELTEVKIQDCSGATSNRLFAKVAKYNGTKCVPTVCIDGYRLENGGTDDAECVEICTKVVLAELHALNGRPENNQCVPTGCVDEYRLTKDTCCLPCKDNKNATCFLMTSQSGCKYETACEPGYKTIVHTGEYNAYCTNAKTYQITLSWDNGAGGTQSKTHVYAYDKGITISDVPTDVADGFRFLGWCENDANCDLPQLKIKIAAGTSGEKKYYAKFARECSANDLRNLNAKNGNFVDDKCVPTECVGEYELTGGKLCCRSCKDNTNATCVLSMSNGQCHYETACKTGYKTIVYDGAYNAYCKNAETYQITLSWDNGAGEMQSKTYEYAYDNGITIPDAVPTDVADGFRFLGWCENDANCASPQLKIEIAAGTSGAKTYYAKFARECSANDLRNLNAKNGNFVDDKCVPTDCVDNYKLTDGVCVEICDANAPGSLNAETVAVRGEICVPTKCIDEYKFDDAKNPTKCIWMCDDVDKFALHAKTLILRDGKCVPSECESDEFILRRGVCVDKKLQEQVKSAEEEYASARENEMSLKNRLMSGAAIGATGFGGMELASGLAEQNADAAVAADMAAYTQKMQCRVGGRRYNFNEKSVNVGGENALTGLYNEYVALADDMARRRTELEQSPGIESAVVFKREYTGLYDDVGSGVQNGTYVSLYRASVGNPNDISRIADDAAKSETRIKTGAAVAGVGAAGGVGGNLIINRPNKQ